MIIHQTIAQTYFVNRISAIFFILYLLKLNFLIIKTEFLKLHIRKYSHFKEAILANLYTNFDVFKCSGKNLETIFKKTHLSSWSWNFSVLDKLKWTLRKILWLEYWLLSKIILLIHLIQYFVVFGYFSMKIGRFFEFVDVQTLVIHKRTQKCSMKIVPGIFLEIIILSKF